MPEWVFSKEISPFQIDVKGQRETHFKEGFGLLYTLYGDHHSDEVFDLKCYVTDGKALYKRRINEVKIKPYKAQSNSQGSLSMTQSQDMDTTELAKLLRYVLLGEYTAKDVDKYKRIGTSLSYDEEDEQVVLDVLKYGGEDNSLSVMIYQVTYDMNSTDALEPMSNLVTEMSANLIQAKLLADLARDQVISLRRQNESLIDATKSEQEAMFKKFAAVLNIRNERISKLEGRAVAHRQDRKRERPTSPEPEQVEEDEDAERRGSRARTPSISSRESSPDGIA
ncbi:hypothetical protein TRVA0_005S02740 [Trichomonascus vanleenenianus]|uniref:uncharacterized protein n=1 Tax=Trichomonascus vanleenenianus TaxID=2268995 RepID=UPI003ECB3CA4